MSGIEKVRNLLKSSLGERNYNDSKVEIKPISSGGANYTSELYELTVTQEHKDTLHLFAKVITVKANKNEEKGQQSMFEIEDKVYRKLKTAYDGIQNKKGIPKNEQFVFSEFIGSSLELGKETFILENLNFKGYQIYDRFNPLENDCLFDTTTALAKFHALGIVLKKERLELYKEFENVEILDNLDHFVDSSRAQLEQHIKAIDEQYRGKVQKFVDNGGYDIFKKFFAFEGSFLIHGDYRSSNILYKKENGKVHVVPVDYQCVHIGCPLTDLLYFIATGTDESFRVKHFEELMEHYYTQLTLYLSKLGIDVNDVYPKKMFQDQLKEMLPATLMLALTMFPLLLVEVEDIPVLTDIKADAFKIFVKPNAKSTERLMGYIRDCERWGII